MLKEKRKYGSKPLPLFLLSSIIASFIFLYSTQSMVRSLLDLLIQWSIFLSLLSMGVLYKEKT